MNIKLKKIEIKNFRGLKNFVMDDVKNEVYIYGANGLGKTSIMDAFIWTLFGKDHEGRSNHNLKVLDKKGNIIPRVDVSVSVTLELDEGKEKKTINLSRIYREEWVKPEREKDEVFKGNTTDYYIDLIPVKKSEYDEKISEILPEDIFKAVTNPLYFPSLPKESQRKMLFSMVPDITDEQIVEKNEAFRFILDEINGSSIDNLKKKIAAQKREINKEIESIPPAIEENKRNIPEKQDWGAIRKEIKELEKQIESIDKQIVDASARMGEENKKRMEIQEQINKIEIDILKLQNSEKQNCLDDIERKEREIAKLTEIIKEKEDDYRRKLKSIESMEKDIEYYEEKINRLREQYKDIASENLVIEEGSLVCPTCLRRLDDFESRIEELRENFNKQKAEKLEANIAEGKKVSQKIKELKEEIKRFNIPEEINTDEEVFRINLLKKEIEETKEKLANPRYTESILYKANLEKMKQLKNEMNAIHVFSTDDLIEQKKEINIKIDNLKTELLKEKQIEEKISRIGELEKMKDILNQELTDIEKREFLVKEFEFTKNSEYVESINKLFEKVRFKLFSQQVNGQVVTDCEATMDGIPFSTLSDAQRIFAGLDIIRALSRYYSISAPIWIDNRESISDIPDMGDTQIINFIVDKNQKQLTVINK